ncbi:uncharacterized protein LOC113337828 [Papaver somniferum]|uniref:uncharacterized protein LOC113337828 n=1 Tax=Papaver somniferum TaxID=3469 RepID=UPI000E6F59D5|nr:uncharacterized protein LOC113337828 [Papaver somniferum]
MRFSTISDEMCTWLERDFDEEECLLAIKSLGQNKAPWSDGFPVSFYLLCWDILKEDFMKVLEDLQDRSFLDWKLKNTFIALIPKKDTIEGIKDLRPISLVHGAYKILSKMLAERFKVSLPSVISQHKRNFIKKRQILDGVLIANELIDSGTRSAKPGLLCKVDFEKAFDHVNWEFIDEILKLIGYGDKWRSWVKCCVEFVKFSVLVNGSASSFFTSKKGIRQGDPLSPFLLLLVGEALSYMLKQAQLQGIISGFQVNNEGTLISNLQFAYDTLIFLDANIEQVKNLRIILLSFELLTGLKINFSKSQIFGVGFDGDLTQFCDILGCYSGILPTIYLGLPLGDKCRGVAKWDNIVDRFIARLAGWKKNILKRAVAEICVDGENGVEWNLISPRRLFGAAAIEHAILISDLVSFTFTPDLEDELQWNICASKVFSVKSLRLLTRDSLRRKGMDVPAECLFCSEPETTSHVLLHCSFAKKIWSKFLEKLNWYFAMPEHPSDVVHSWHLKKSSDALTYLWNLIPAEVLWCIWQERNARVFTDKVCNDVAVTNKVIYCLYSSSLVIKDFDNLSSSDVMEN